MYDFAACLWKIPHTLEICSFSGNKRSRLSPKDHYILVDFEKREEVLSGSLCISDSSSRAFGEAILSSWTGIWHDCCYISQ